MDAIAKHQKAIRILELIKEVEYRGSCHYSYANEPNVISQVYEWNIRRLGINRKIKKRLQNYYDKNFKI